MIFHYGKKCAGRFVEHKYFSNFLGTVPTFGFRISIVENVRSQNFYEELIVGSTRILSILITFRMTHVFIRACQLRKLTVLFADEI